jgi:regulator of nucleoside diphosphate kinase
VRDRIYITRADSEKLRRLIAGRRGAHSLDARYLDTLEEELDRAKVVASRAIPHNVVTMDSEVKLMDLDTGEVKVYRLVFPSEPRTDGSVSVLAPIGTAILGYRAGDVIEWPVPKGMRRLKVVEVAQRACVSVDEDRAVHAGE